MRRSPWLGAALLTMVGVALCVPMLWAQSAAAPRATTTSDTALLEEVRALRADLAAASRASLRAQMLLARVQLQEQRIIYLDRRRADAAARVTDAAEKARQSSAHITEMEEQQRRFKGMEIPREQRDAMVAQIAFELEKARADGVAAIAAEQSMRAEEAELVGALSTEQGRWNEFNARLDELERSLPK